MISQKNKQSGASVDKVGAQLSRRLSSGALSLRRRLSGVLLGCAMLPGVLDAQSLSEFEQWKRQYMGEFKQYKDEIDREFADFLKQEWKPFATEEGVIRDKSPKPPQIPVARVEPERPVVKPPKQPPVLIPRPLPRVPPVTRIPEPVVPPEPVEQGVTLVFLGHELSISDGISGSLTDQGSRVTQAGIQQTFSQLAQSDYPATLTRLLSIKRQLKLNDWAYVQLIQRYVEQLPTTNNNRHITSWFLLLKSGLDARIAYDRQQVYLLVAVRQSLFDVAYFTFGQQKYYAVSRQKQLPPNLYSYDGKYPKKLNVSDFSLVQVNSKPDDQFKRLSFSFEGKDHQLEIPYNRHTVDFLSTYPQMGIDQYFQAPLDDTTAEALLSQLSPLVSDLTETQAVNLLLGFVQKAFRYQTDQDQFGEENYMFIQETIYYPGSDCEDRSVIFAWLVNKLLGLDVVGLDFPGHVATAVALKQPQGEVITHRQRQYTIADPTYINARVGMKMPQFKRVTPKVISIL